MPLAFESIATLSQDLKNGEVSSRQLVEQAVARIYSLNPQLNAVVCLEAEQALANADQADARRAKGEHSPLLGIPMLHKDIFCTKNVLTPPSLRRVGADPGPPLLRRRRAQCPNPMQR